MNYCKLILKKVLKNKLNIIPFVLVCIFIIFIYYGNHRLASISLEDPIFTGEEQIEKLEGYVSYLKKEFAMESNSDNDTINQNLNMAEHLLSLNQRKLDSINNEDWSEYYKSNLELTDIQLNTKESDTSYRDDELINVLKLDQKYYQYMLNYDLNFDDRFDYTQGISYMTEVFNDLLPFILIFLLIYISSSMYCSTIIEHINIQFLVPMSRLKKQCVNLLSSEFIGLMIVLFIGVISILCGSIGNSLGNFNSPILSYTLQGIDTYIPFLSILPQFIGLIVFSTFFVINCVSVISIFTKKHLTCFLVSLIIIAGFLIITQNIIPLQPYIHVFPTTYLNSFQVVSGQLSFIANNENINFFNGICILGISNLLLILFNYFLLKNPNVLSNINK